MSISIRTALAPEKHVRFSQSGLAVAGWARQHLDSPRTLDELWALAQRSQTRTTAFRRKTTNQAWAASFRFDDLVYAILLLFALGEVTMTEADRVKRVSR